MQISPWDDAFKRPELRQETREFDLPNGRKFALTLQEMDPLQEAACFDRYQEYVEQHLTNKEPLLSPFGERLTPSRSMLAAIATLELMQKPENGQQPYNLLDWMGFAQRLPEFWRQVTAFADSFAPARTDDGEGNSLTSAPENDAPTGTPSTT